MPPSVSNGIKSQNVGSEIHNSKFYPDNSRCASIPEKAAYLEQSLLDTAFKNKERRKEQPQDKGKNNLDISIEDCDAGDQIDKLQIQSLQRSIVSENKKKPTNDIKITGSDTASKQDKKQKDIVELESSDVPGTKSVMSEHPNTTLPKKKNISLLEYHMKCYESNKKKIDRKNNDPNSFKQAKERLKKKINCLKFNYALEGIV